MRPVGGLCHHSAPPGLIWPPAEDCEILAWMSNATALQCVGHKGWRHQDRQPGSAMQNLEQIQHDLHEHELNLLKELRLIRRGLRRATEGRPKADLTTGQKIADAVAATMGSWPFIIVQTTILALWIGANVTAWVNHWDPYPFILLNLALSFQAAYAAPFIMMAQNRQQDIDRMAAENDHQVNVKAELEIELLHQKIDALREKEVLALTQAIAVLSKHLEVHGLTPPKS
jgi:uncharacterized membrane protein